MSKAAEDDAVDRYRGTGHAAINGAIRAGKDHPDSRHLDAVIGRSVLPEGVTVHRGLKDLPGHGIKSPGDAVGAVIHDKGYTSVTPNPGWSRAPKGEHGILRIHLPAGTNAAKVNKGEYVLPRGGHYKITGVRGKTGEGHTLFDARLHEPEDALFGGMPPPPIPDQGAPARFSWSPGDASITPGGV